MSAEVGDFLFDVSFIVACGAAVLFFVEMISGCIQAYRNFKTDCKTMDKWNQDMDEFVQGKRFFPPSPPLDCIDKGM